ncbi:MAG: valine--tRNA ligase, partial [Candidatus Ureaplasma intestinipullorum]|nr:valine--tRNA ligase [Candidatus Ureaplasma intestinipullorum]
MKNLSNKYNHIDVEKNKYDFWLENKLFSPKNDVKENFCVILPPPNVTGKLHLGHAWDVSLQDVLVRYNILLGKNVLWVPGTDHAGIATQTKFEKILKETENLTLEDLGREKFLEKIWVWAKSQSDFIHKQWKKMGIALSYDYEKFTLDTDMNQAVNYVFVELYKNNLIYRKKKLVNWDPILQTAISNIEVIHKETKSKMYYFKYFTEDKKDFVVVATTRPETMFGDVCLVANPKDKRYLKYADKKFINPANGELLPLIFDDYIDIEFGTGIMKCTPAHDFNDNELAKRHNLKVINILNPDGTIISEIEKYGNLDRFECREKLVEYIKSIGMLDHIEDIENKIGYSERTNAIVEPFLSWQWFIDIKPLANKILEMQKNENEKVQFVPEHFNNTLIQWLNNIEDWCISRQLIWGHQIPIWYKKGTNEIYCDVKPPKDEENWTRDPDVLDTWFSSGLWPFITLGWPFKNDLLDKYFPTSVLVTGYDIIFFWVSRMMMFSKFFTNK